MKNCLIQKFYIEGGQNMNSFMFRNLNLQGHLYLLLFLIELCTLFIINQKNIKFQVKKY